MSGQLWFMLGAGVLAGLGGGVPLGRLGRRRALDQADQEGYDEGRTDGYQDGITDAYMSVADDRAVEPPPTEPLLVGHTIYPELAALADVPEPETTGVTERAHEPVRGLGHPSPYTGPLTPAQRRRDKHKQRGPYAPGDLPDPPTDVGAWWQAELDALLVDGQSEWLTRNLAGAA